MILLFIYHAFYFLLIGVSETKMPSPSAGQERAAHLPLTAATKPNTDASPPAPWTNHSAPEPPAAKSTEFPYRRGNLNSKTFPKSFELSHIITEQYMSTIFCIYLLPYVIVCQMLLKVTTNSPPTPPPSPPHTLL